MSIDNIAQAIKILNTGGIIIYPTDTAYGIGCRIDNEDAVKRLFSIRKRPETKPTPVLVTGPDMVEKFATAIPKSVRQQLIDPYWPGALTIVLPAQTDKVPSLVRGGTETIGVRMPKHGVAYALINGIGVPLLGPSANFHGEQTPFELSDLDDALVGQVDYVVEAACGKSPTSTVVDCTVSPWKIIRQGAITLAI